MSSDEDFSLVTTPSEESLEGIQASINSFKKKYEQLLDEQKELNANREDLCEMKEKCKQRTEKIKVEIIKDKQSHVKNLANEKMKLAKLEQEEKELEEEIERVTAAVKDEKANNLHLKQEADVFAAVPEREVIFKGQTGKASNSQDYEMEAYIVYPMEGGTALITFEEEVVAKKILTTKKHQVDLGGDCSISVEAREVHLMVPELVEIDSQVCPRRILISNLPKMETDTLLNKLEIHFSKSKNGGGEVEECEMMSDSGTVVLTFVGNNIASGLTETEQHEVKLQQKKHKVRVTPFINGKITNVKTKMSVCPRTVLLTGIPVVMERDTLQDLLEIHFQKSTNGGGEIESFLYNPLGEETMAQFEAVPPKSEEEE
ncbi:interferon-induced protein 35 [Scomber scombrus]|uniref:Interferon-induced protein 35 n=1 Tax=Scomber scombrus TaxID=13677 RepID=A0AAV1PAH3_SCOSC